MIPWFEKAFLCLKEEILDQEHNGKNRGQGPGRPGSRAGPATNFLTEDRVL